jgi:hypothetical protein
MPCELPRLLIGCRSVQNWPVLPLIFRHRLLSNRSKHAPRCYPIAVAAAFSTLKMILLEARRLATPLNDVTGKGPRKYHPSRLAPAPCQGIVIRAYPRKASQASTELDGACKLVSALGDVTNHDVCTLTRAIGTLLARPPTADRQALPASYVSLRLQRRSRERQTLSSPQSNYLTLRSKVCLQIFSYWLKCRQGKS